MINGPLFTSFSKTLLTTTNHRKKTNKAVVFSCGSSPTFLGPLMKHLNNLENTNPSDILKTSNSMYESSVSQSFRTNTGIQSGPDIFHESRFVMTFLTTLGDTEALCSFTLVLEGKTGK